MFGDGLMPKEAFLTQGLSRQKFNCLIFLSISFVLSVDFIADQTEAKLVRQAFELAEGIADLKLTESELALFSAFILIAPGLHLIYFNDSLNWNWFCVFNESDRSGLKGIIDIQRLNQAIVKALRYELSRTHKMPFKGDVSVYDVLMTKINPLRELNLLHMEALSKFRRASPHLEFPPLHKELFSIDIWKL